MVVAKNLATLLTDKKFPVTVRRAHKPQSGGKMERGEAARAKEERLKNVRVVYGDVDESNGRCLHDALKFAMTVVTCRNDFEKLYNKGRPCVIKSSHRK